MSPTSSIQVDIKEGAIRTLRDTLGVYDRPLFVTDVMIYDKYGQMVEDLVEANIIWSISPEYQKGMVSRYSGVDVILGFGGGKSIDMAKLFAHEADLDWISIPTAASHDGIASDVASVMHNSYRYSQKCRMPIRIVADLSIIATAPSILTLSGIGDMVSKTSSLTEWRLAHDHADEPLDEDIFQVVDKALKTVLIDDGLEGLVRSLIDTGNAMTEFGSSRPCSGTEHAISHAMDRRMQSLHGLQVAFASPLSLYFLNEAGYTDYSPTEIRDYLREKRIPTTLYELDMSLDTFLDDIHHALKIMEKRERFSVLSYRNVTDKELVSAIKELGY